MTTERSRPPEFNIRPGTPDDCSRLASIEEPDPAYMGIGQVSVVREHGRKGIGGALMGAATDHIAEAGAKFISLATFTNIPWNDRWYESLGYDVVDPADHTDWMSETVSEQVADGLPWDDRVWMVRQLD